MHLLLNAVFSSPYQYLSAVLVSDTAHGHHRHARATAIPQLANNPILVFNSTCKFRLALPACFAACKISVRCIRGYAGIINELLFLLYCFDVWDLVERERDCYESNNQGCTFVNVQIKTSIPFIS